MPQKTVVTIMPEKGILKPINVFLSRCHHAVQYLQRHLYAISIHAWVNSAMKAIFPNTTWPSWWRWIARCGWNVTNASVPLADVGLHPVVFKDGKWLFEGGIGAISMVLSHSIFYRLSLLPTLGILAASLNLCDSKKETTQSLQR